MDVHLEKPEKKTTLPDILSYLTRILKSMSSFKKILSLLYVCFEKEIKEVLKFYSYTNYILFAVAWMYQCITFR